MEQLLSPASSRARRGVVFAITVVGTLTMAGCATVVNGRQQHVLVVSEPPGAEVLLNGESVGITPADVRMRRRAPTELQLQKPGYVTATVSVSRGVSRWVAVNLIYFNPFAAQGMDSVSLWLLWASTWVGTLLTVDFLSGGAYVRPPVVNVTLTPIEERSAPLQRCQLAACR